MILLFVLFLHTKVHITDVYEINDMLMFSYVILSCGLSGVVRQSYLLCD